MVVEQVHLVDIKDVAVGLGEHARLESTRALLQGRLEVDGPHHPVLGRVDRQLDHPHTSGRHRQLARPRPLPAVGAPVLGVVRVAPEMTAFHHLLVRKQTCQRSHRRGLAGAFLAADEHAPDRRVDGVENQRELHLILADDRGEGVGVAVYCHGTCNVTDRLFQVPFPPPTRSRRAGGRRGRNNAPPCARPGLRRR